MSISWWTGYRSAERMSMTPCSHAQPSRKSTFTIFMTCVGANEKSNVCNTVAMGKGILLITILWKDTEQKAGNMYDKCERKRPWKVSFYLRQTEWWRTTQQTFIKQVCQNTCCEIANKTYFHFPRYKAMKNLSCHSNESTWATAIKTQFL